MPEETTRHAIPTWDQSKNRNLCFLERSVTATHRTTGTLSKASTDSSLLTHSILSIRITRLVTSSQQHSHIHRECAKAHTANQQPKLSMDFQKGNLKSNPTCVSRRVHPYSSLPHTRTTHVAKYQPIRYNSRPRSTHMQY